MLTLGTTYLIVKDMQKSIVFYEKLLNRKVTHQNQDRWAQFDFAGSSISLYNPAFDQKQIQQAQNLSQKYNQAYLNYIQNTPIIYGNNIVLNFFIDNLAKEYQRLKKLNLAPLSDILFINIAAPYYCFILHDPDGNQIEIAGNHTAP